MRALPCFQSLLSLNNFGRKTQIGFAADAFKVINEHGLAVRRRFRDAYVTWDYSLINLVSHELAHIGDNLVGEIVARVIHCQDDPVDRKSRIKSRLVLLDGLQKLRQPFERE